MTGVLAVHLSDGFVGTPAAAAGYVAAAGLVAASAWRLRDDEIPRVGVMTAVFFVASQKIVPLGFTSAHLLLNGLLAAVLGRRAVVAIAVGLFLQAFLFAHGGLVALGLNVCVYSIPAIVCGAAFRRIRRTGRVPDFVLGFALGLATAALTVAANFFALRYAGRDGVQAVRWVVLAVNAPVVVAEAFGVGFAVRYLAAVKPEWLAGGYASGKISSNGTSH